VRRVGIELGEVEKIFAAQDLAARRHRPRLESTQTFSQVTGPAGLAELPVVDHIDTNLGLLLHHLGDRALEGSGVPGLVVGSSLERIIQLGWARQAADVSRENSISTALHSPVPFKAMDLVLSELVHLVAPPRHDEVEDCLG
jgi:hypothetical protein